MSQDRDFVIELDGQPGSYRLHVSSPAGDDSVDVGLDPACLGVDLDTLQARVLASATTSRSMRVPELERPLREVGQALFGAVFQASAGALFLSSRNEVERAGGRLRIVLRLHPPELAVLPWELLFSDHYGGYLCRRSSMVRYVDAPEPVRPLTVTPPLRVLGMTALPGDLAALDADTEQRRLQQLLAPLQDRGLIAVDWVAGQSWEAAQDALYARLPGVPLHRARRVRPGPGRRRDRVRGRAGPPAAGGGLGAGGPAQRGRPHAPAGDAQQLPDRSWCGYGRVLQHGRHLGPHGACGSRDAVRGHRRCCGVFSRAFYQALVHNRGVDEAVRAGRIALTGWNPGTLEWVTPVLYLRSRDTRLFDLTDPGAAPVGADDQPQPRREAVLAKYWAARSTGDWEAVISQLGALARQLPGDREVGQAYQDARLAARYAQGRRAEQEQDWPSAIAHYRAVSEAQPEYRDVAARLAECARRRDIVALQEQLRVMFTAGEFQAVAGIAGRLAELDPAAADPDGLTTQAQQRLQQRNADLPPAEPLPAAIPAPGTGPAQHPKPVSSTATAPIPEAEDASRRTLAGHTQAVYGVAFSPDGRLLATLRRPDGAAVGPGHRHPAAHPARPHRPGPRCGVQPGRAAAGQLRRRQDGAAVGPGHRRRSSAPCPATPARSTVWHSARTGGCWPAATATRRCGCGTRPPAPSSTS